MGMDPPRFAVRFSEKYTRDLERVAKDLDISKTEVLRRALTLYMCAVKADSVEITTKLKKRTILVK